MPELEHDHPSGIGAGRGLYRAGRLCDYYDWLAMRPTRSARRFGSVVSAVADVVFLPFILVAPSVGFTVWIGGKATTAAIQRAMNGRRRVLQRIERDRRQARAVSLAEVETLESGISVRVRGRVRLRTSVPGTLTPHHQVAYEWLVVREERLPERSFFVERARAFELVDEVGDAIRVNVQNARMVVEWHPALRRAGVDVAARVRDVIPSAVTGRRRLALNSLVAADLQLTAGAEIEIFGFTERVIDPSAPALPRDVPTRGALTGYRDRPLVVMPPRALAQRDPT